MPIARLDRTHTGKVCVLYFQNLVNAETVQPWGTLPGPAFVEEVVADLRSITAPALRAWPFAGQGIPGQISGADARAARDAGLSLAENVVNVPGQEHSVGVIAGGTTNFWWRPRKWVPMQSWQPCLWVRPTLLGQIWSCYFLVSWPAGVQVGGAPISGQVSPEVMATWGAAGRAPTVLDEQIAREQLRGMTALEYLRRGEVPPWITGPARLVAQRILPEALREQEEALARLRAERRR
jgi:hypothetical protein